MNSPSTHHEAVRTTLLLCSTLLGFVQSFDSDESLADSAHSSERKLDHNGQYHHKSTIRWSISRTATTAITVAFSVIVVFFMILLVSRKYLYQRFSCCSCLGVLIREEDRDETTLTVLRTSERPRYRNSRKSRLEWYETYLKDYSKVLKESDFISPDQEDTSENSTSGDDEEQDPVESHHTENKDIVDSTTVEKETGKNSRHRSNSDVSASAMEEGSNKKSRHRSNSDVSTSALEEGSIRRVVLTRRPSRRFSAKSTRSYIEPKYVRIEEKRVDGTTTCRVVEGNCAICFKEYEVGTEIVWATNGAKTEASKKASKTTGEDAVDRESVEGAIDVESDHSDDCPHVFDKDCIMAWLSRGKKRCPICRRWFVPPVHIADQKRDLYLHNHSHLFDGEFGPAAGR